MVSVTFHIQMEPGPANCVHFVVAVAHTHTFIQLAERAQFAGAVACLAFSI